VNLSGLKLIDLSVPLAPCVSEAVPVSIEYMAHECGGAHLAELVGMQQADLQEGLGWASERVSAITHSSTHVDAPFHYSPQCDGRPSRTVDELPLDWFWGPGVCIPVDASPQQDPVTTLELEAFEEKHGRSIGAGDIVLFRTGAESHYGSASYNEQGRGLSPSLVEALCGRGVRLFGTDAWSIDPPFHLMRQRLGSVGPSSVWEAHFAGRKVEFCAIEKLSNLDKLPPAGFWVACFPIKVLRGSAAWVRAVAFLNGV
jgi:kynurenine formamidase